MLLHLDINANLSMVFYIFHDSVYIEKEGGCNHAEHFPLLLNHQTSDKKDKA